METGRVVTEVEAVGFDDGLVTIERGMEVAEVGGVVLGREPPGGNVWYALYSHRNALRRRGERGRFSP
jgi:hypothetical protein